MQKITDTWRFFIDLASKYCKVFFAGLLVLNTILLFSIRATQNIRLDDTKIHSIRQNKEIMKIEKSVNQKIEEWQDSLKKNQNEKQKIINHINNIDDDSLQRAVYGAFENK